MYIRRRVAPEHAADSSAPILDRGWNAIEKEIGSSTMCRYISVKIKPKLKLIHYKKITQNHFLISKTLIKTGKITRLLCFGQNLPPFVSLFTKRILNVFICDNKNPQIWISQTCKLQISISNTKLLVIMVINSINLIKLFINSIGL